MVRLILVLGLMSLLSACGWHLRGSIVLPANIESVYIDNRASNRELEDDLINLLQSNGVALSQSAANTDLMIVILDFNQRRRVNSVNSNTIVSEYELISEAEYEIKDAAGVLLLEPDVIQLSRIYTFDQNAVVSAAEEAQLIQQELRLELAQQIVRRLRFLNRETTVNSEQ
jgi:LPS-assembly lipoprotein